MHSIRSRGGLLACQPYAPYRTTLSAIMFMCTCQNRKNEQTNRIPIWYLMWTRETKRCTVVLQTRVAKGKNRVTQRNALGFHGVLSYLSYPQHGTILPVCAHGSQPLGRRSWNCIFWYGVVIVFVLVSLQRHCREMLEWCECCSLFRQTSAEPTATTSSCCLRTGEKRELRPSWRNTTLTRK